MLQSPRFLITLVVLLVTSFVAWLVWKWVFNSEIPIYHAGYSLDRARAALKWFGAYVPKNLIVRIMQAGEAALVSRKQLVTVLFTDIVHFSQITRGSPVGEVADMLNQHFAILGTCIEREGGLIDKFIGDAAMATWGSLPEVTIRLILRCAPLSPSFPL